MYMYFPAQVTQQAKIGQAELTVNEAKYLGTHHKIDYTC